MLKIHLGCGARLEPGWINLDLELPTSALNNPDVPAREIDVRRGLPCGAGSIDMIYSEHFVEHLTAVEGANLFRECARVLKVGGLMRISTPDLAAVTRAYENGELEIWKPVGYLPKTACQMVNESLTLWGHRFTYDFAELSTALLDAGFHGVVRPKWRESIEPDMLTEGRPFCQDLIVEARK
jgi:predicted SAM-dependent methyltransferase